MAAYAAPNITIDPKGYAEWKQNLNTLDEFSRKGRRSGKNKRAFHEAAKSLQNVEWTELPDKPEMRTLRSILTGDTYSIPLQDYEQLVQYTKHQSERSDAYNADKKYRNIQTPADYIDYAMSNAQANNIVETDVTDGHIVKIRYNATYKILIVQFRKMGNFGNTCAFFDVPANTAALLLKLGREGTLAPPDKHGNERHAVGVEFWNLVRVRGTVHETRYPFEYVDPIKDAVEGIVGHVAGGGRSGNTYNKFEYERDENGNIIKRTPVDEYGVEKPRNERGRPAYTDEEVIAQENTISDERIKEYDNAYKADRMNKAVFTGSNYKGEMYYNPKTGQITPYKGYEQFDYRRLTPEDIKDIRDYNIKSRLAENAKRKSRQDEKQKAYQESKEDAKRRIQAYDNASRQNAKSYDIDAIDDYFDEANNYYTEHLSYITKHERDPKKRRQAITYLLEAKRAYDAGAPASKIVDLFVKSGAPFRDPTSGDFDLEDYSDMDSSLSSEMLRYKK